MGEIVSQSDCELYYNFVFGYFCMPQLSMNPRPNITIYHVCMEDGSGNSGKLGFGQRTTKYYQFWKFEDDRFSHLDLGTTTANTSTHKQL